MKNVPATSEAHITLSLHLPDVQEPLMHQTAWVGTSDSARSSQLHDMKLLGTRPKTLWLRVRLLIDPIDG